MLSTQYAYMMRNTPAFEGTKHLDDEQVKELQQET